MQKDYIMFSC